MRAKTQWRSYFVTKTNHKYGRKSTVKLDVTELSTLIIRLYETAILEVSTEADTKIHLIDFSVVNMYCAIVTANKNFEKSN